MKRHNITLECEQCGESFHPQYGRETVSRFCSNRCYLIHRWGEPVATTCHQCGVDTTKMKGRGRKFCSHACYSESKKGVGTGGGIIRYGANGNYRARHVPEHPYCDCKGYVMEHRLIMERHIGRYLPPEEVVHHIDEDCANNQLENLQLMLKPDHDRYHTSKRWANHTFKSK